MIELSDISKTYAKSAKKAVDQLSLSIPDGRIFGFLGPNGAGKTTTIRILSGALTPDTGSIAVDGISMVEKPMDAKRRLGLVHDNPELFNRLKAHEFLDFVGDVYGVPTIERQERIEDLAGRFDLADALGASIGRASCRERV